MNNRPGIDSTFLLIAKRWKPEDCCDSTTFVNQQFAMELQKSGFGVLSTVLEATDEDVTDAQMQNITLILPKPKSRSYKIEKSDWLMYPDRYYRGLKKHVNVSFIVGHVNEKGYDTVEEACIIRDRYFEQAALVIFIHHISDAKNFGRNNVIGERDILQFAKESVLVLVVGHSLHSYYLGRLEKPTILYLPAPDEIYLASNVRPLPVDANIEILSVVNSSNKKALQYCNHIAQAMGKVTSNFSTMHQKCPIWKVCYKNEEDVGRFDRDLFHKCKAVENLKKVDYYYDGDMNNLLTIFMQSTLLIDTSEDVFSITGLNAIAAGLPVLFKENSSIANFLKSDCFLELHSGDILVQLAVNETFDVAAGKWAEVVTKCLVDGDSKLLRASVLKEGLLKSMKEGSIKKSHQEILTWLRMKIEKSVTDCLN
ncbi:uncharacterized protein [Ptychodera flava]|uniref:uncharacterized protein n=1 Tax=Ptychodera flava TaxID=63121 RepID=UPI00396A9AA5